jgi:hypothetical protein
MAAQDQPLTKRNFWHLDKLFQNPDKERLEGSH